MIDWEQKCKELEAFVEQLEDSNRYLQDTIDQLQEYKYMYEDLCK